MSKQRKSRCAERAARAVNAARSEWREERRELRAEIERLRECGKNVSAQYIARIAALERFELSIRHGTRPAIALAALDKDPT